MPQVSKARWLATWPTSKLRVIFVKGGGIDRIWVLYITPWIVKITRQWLLVVTSTSRGHRRTQVFDRRWNSIPNSFIVFIGLRGWRVALNIHLLVIMNGWRWPILLPDWNDLIDNDPGMVTTCEDPVDIFGAYIGNMLEGCPWVLVFQSTISDELRNLPSC